MTVAEMQNASVPCTSGQQELPEDCLLLWCGVPLAFLDAIASSTKGNSFTRNEARFAYYPCNLFQVCCKSCLGAATGKFGHWCKATDVTVTGLALPPSVFFKGKIN